MSNIHKGLLYQVWSGRFDLFLVLSRFPHATLVACEEIESLFNKVPDKNP